MGPVHSVRSAGARARFVLKNALAPSWRSPRTLWQSLFMKFVLLLSTGSADESENCPYS